MKTIQHFAHRLLLAIGLACALSGAAVAATSQVSKPAFDPASGASFDSRLKVKVTTSTSGAKVRYTTNGSQPTASSPEVPSSGIELGATTTIKARAFKSGLKDSDVASATYRKVEKIAKPALTPADGTEFETSLTVRASTATAGATLRYTTNGSEPTASSPTLPAGGLTVTATATVKVRGFKSGMKDSDVTSATYRKIEKVAKPSLSPQDGTEFENTLVVRAWTSTSGATIRFRTDGGNPTASSPVFPSNGLTLDKTTTVKVRAFKSGMNSDVASATYIKADFIVLLLHGMNSNPAEAWDSHGKLLHDSRFFTFESTLIGGVPVQVQRKENVATIDGGKITDERRSDPAKDGVFYYCVKFGSKDDGIGLEPDCKAGSNGETSGDFTSFAGLASEIDLAVQRIRKSHDAPRIVLVGHSRGGIAARAFLQNANYSTRSFVVGVVTTGTPHAGSPFGRLYNYLDTNRTNEWGRKDWSLVKNSIVQSDIDLRRPVIGQLSAEGSEIKALTNGLTQLPRSIKFATLTYNAADFGEVGYGKNVFIPGFWKALSTNASNAVHLAVAPISLKGDGIVPAASMTFSANGIQVTNLIKTDKVLHTKQTGQMSHLREAMKSVVTWWKQ